MVQIKRALVAKIEKRGRMNILGTGLSGLVGSRVVELLTPDFQFKNLSLETGVDITDKDQVDQYFASSDAPWVFHMAAYTNVQKAEEEHDRAWNVNVLATENISKNCKKFGKRLLYIDTDYAFDGTKKVYTEDDDPNPAGWYAKSKTEGAKFVLGLGELGLIIRISNPYRAHPVGKTDWIHKMLERFTTGQPVSAPADQLFSPTFIDDIAGALRVLIGNNSYGIYHVVSSPALSPYDAALTIAKTYGYNQDLVRKTTFAEMFAGRVPIPQYAVLKNDKIKSLGVTMHTFSDGISEVKKQESL